MLRSKERIIYLLDVWISGTATSEEEHELLDKIGRKEYKDIVEDHVEQLVKQNDSKELPGVDWEKMYGQILEGRQPSMTFSGSRRNMPWFRWAAAAAFLILLTAAAWWFIPGTFNKKTIVSANKAPLQNDIPSPTSSKATLTLPGGTVIDLETASNGSLASAGAANASKLNDGLVYNSKAAVIEWHTLANPKGSKPIHLQLSDGSEVWLNAASSVTFPTIFNEADRKVNITGEAYFEVAKNTGKKFLVSANGTTTQVLGTHFNINAYENEAVLKVTLLEGLVHTIRGSESARLRPGQQANFYASEPLKVFNNVDIEEVMAWKENMFEFNETDIQSIMRQIERWYNVEVFYNENIALKFNGSIQRQVNVSKVLDMLEKTGGVRFQIEGKKVVVKKY